MATTSTSKKMAIKRLVAKEMPGWQLVEPSAAAVEMSIALADSATERPSNAADLIGAGPEQVQRKYSKTAPIKRGGNGSLVRLKSTSTVDARKGSKAAFVHDGKILGLQG